MSKINKIFTLLFFVFISESLIAQQSSSPYSRFGLGDLKSQFSPFFNSLGGGGFAINDSKVINPFSPATYSSFESNSFLFSTGLNNELVNIESNDESQTLNNFNDHGFIIF